MYIYIYKYKYINHTLINKVWVGNQKRKFKKIRKSRLVFISIQPSSVLYCIAFSTFLMDQ